MKRTSVGAVFLSVVVDLIGFGIVLPLLPLYADDFHATGAQIGMLIACFSAMQFLFAPIWGRVSDRIGRRPVLLIGLAGSVIFYTVFGLADSVTWLFVSRIGAGVCGATISTAAAFIADVTPPRERARGMALIGVAFGVGFTLGPPIGLYAAHLGDVLAKDGHLTHEIGRALPGFAAALISLGSFLWTFAAVGEPPRHRSERRRIWDMAALRTAHSPRAVLLLLGFSFLSVFAFSNFEGTLSLMLTDRMGYSKQRMGMVFLFVGVVLATAQGVLVRRIVHRVGERAMVRGGFVLMAAGLYGLAICDSLALLLGSLAVAVTGFGCVTPSFSSLISRQADPDHQGGVMGMAQSASALGRIFGPYVGNIVYAPAGEQGSVLGPLLSPLFGDLEFHRRPYVLGAVLVVVLAAAALGTLPAPPPVEEDAAVPGAEIPLES